MADVQDVDKNEDDDNVWECINCGESFVLTPEEVEGGANTDFCSDNCEIEYNEDEADIAGDDTDEDEFIDADGVDDDEDEEESEDEDEGDIEEEDKPL